MTDKEKAELNKLFNEDNKLKEKTILVIESRPKLTVSDDEEGVELNDGYEFKVNGALPEIADSIAKLAFELPKNGFGEKSDLYFIQLIHQYFDNLKNNQ